MDIDHRTARANRSDLWPEPVGTDRSAAHRCVLGHDRRYAWTLCDQRRNCLWVTWISDPSVGARTVQRAIAYPLQNPCAELRRRTSAISIPSALGDRIRLRTTPIALTGHARGTLLHLKHVIETDQNTKPALVFVRLSLVLNELLADAVPIKLARPA